MPNRTAIGDRETIDTTRIRAGHFMTPPVAQMRCSHPLRISSVPPMGGDRTRCQRRVTSRPETQTDPLAARAYHGARRARAEAMRPGDIVSFTTQPDYAALFDLHRAVLDAYALTDERAGVPMAADFTLKRLLGALMPGDALISFNWDTAAEHVAVKLGLDLVPAGCAGAKDRVRLIKPHGSVSWPHCIASPGSTECTVLWEDSGAPRFRPMKPEDVSPGSPGHFHEPLVLDAVPIKSELLAEVQQYPKVPRDDPPRMGGRRPRDHASHRDRRGRLRLAAGGRARAFSSARSRQDARNGPSPQHRVPLPA